jgi:dipeptidyl aminopeptidase/acylaminoacyl peptidase
MTQPEWNESTFAEFTAIADPRISADATWVTFVTTKPNLASDKNESILVIRNLETGAERYIANGALARFSPDSVSVAYVQINEKEQKSELRILDTRTGDSRKLLESKAVSEVHWSRDGRKLCVVSSKKAEDPHVLFESDIPLWFDGKGFSDREKTLISVHDSSSGAKLEEIQVDFQALPYFPVALWHGDSLVYNVPSKNRPFSHGDIRLASNGETRTLFEKTSFRAVASNGSTLVLLGKQNKKNYAEHNFVYSWNGSELTALTERFGYDDLGYAFPRIDSAGRVYYTSTRGGRVQLTTLQDGGECAIVDEDAWVTGFDVSSEGTIVFVKETSYEPPEVFCYRPNEGVVKLTSYNELIARKLTMRKLNRIECRSLGGATIEGWYLKPDIKEGTKSTLIVFIHGGPKGAYGHGFDHLGQTLASKGYFVLYSNPRGSNGYDENFALCILGKYGVEDSQDILNVMEELMRREPAVDPERVGVTGISGGGYLTNWMITHSDKFAAAISENGISNWFTHYAFSDIGFWFCKDLIGEAPLTNENYKILSPIYRADKVNTPIMFIHSTEDYRCPLDQSVMFYQALRDLNKEAYIAVFRRGPHAHSFLATPVHRMKRHKLMIDFFDSKLVKKKAAFKPSI